MSATPLPTWQGAYPHGRGATRSVRAARPGAGVLAAVVSEIARPLGARAPVDVAVGRLVDAAARPRVVAVHDHREEQDEEGEEDPRSEERRVGKECRSRWSPEH